MKDIRNSLYYLTMVTISIVMMYFIVQKGELLQSDDIVSSTHKSLEISWIELFKESLYHNFNHPLSVLLLQIIMILAGARIFGWVFRQVGQPAVIGEVVAGIILGPSVVGAWFPGFFDFLFPVTSLHNLQFLSQIGLLLFMFVIGMELDLKMVRTKARDAIVISHVSIAVQYALGIGLAYYLYKEFAPPGIEFLSFSLFIGIALSITAFPVLARIIREKGMSRTKVGTIAITCAANDDIMAWCILAAVISIVKSGSSANLYFTIALVIGYLTIMIFAVKPFLEKYNRRRIDTDSLSLDEVALKFAVLLLSAYTTEIIGIHALFGAFFAGVIMPSSPGFREKLTDKVEYVSLALLLPLFFAFSGLRTQIGLLNDAHLWKVCGIIILVAVAGKFGVGMISARMTGQSWKDSFILGALLNTRGLMELIVLNIGYDLGVLNPQIFSMMVLMALVTTFMTGPVLQLMKNHIRKETLF